MSKLNKILADFPILKQAVESPDREQHEKDFSQLAFAFLQDRAAGLLPYLLGFEVVDRDEDGAKAVGIFGFNISGHYYYVPAFFINSQIKGMDLLFSKTTNNFMPLQEEWIDKVINKSGIRLGRPETSDDIQQDFESPDLTNMIEPPIMTGKTASVNPTADLSAHLAHNAWNAMQKTAAEALKSDAAFQEAFAGAIAAMTGRQLEKSANNKIVPFISAIGGPRTMESFMRSMQNIKYANAFFEFYDDLGQFHVTKYAEELKPVEVEFDLKVTDNVQDVNAKIKSTDDSNREKARLITDGFAVIDNRKDSDKSVVYEKDVSGILAAPDEAGVYDIWTDSEEFKQVIALPVYKEYTDKNFLFIDASTGESCEAPASSAISSKRFEKSLESVSKPLSSLNAPGDGKDYIEDNYRKNRYCVFDPESGQALIVNLDRRMSNSDGHTFKLYNVEGLIRKRVDSEGLKFHPTETFNVGNCSSCCCEVPCYDGEYPQYLKVSSLDGDRVYSHGDTLVIPKNFRAIKLGKDDRVFIGSSAALDSHLFDTGFGKVDVDFDGIDYSVNVNGNTSDRLSKKEACVKLVKDCGLSVHDMDELVARAEAGTHKPVFVKFAQLVGVDMPMPVPPGPSADPYTGMGLPMEEPFIANQPGTLSGVPALQDSTQPGFADGGQSAMEVGGGGGAPGGALSDDVVQLADQAAQSGQKHVFDQSTIAGLAGLYDIGYAIDMYIPELTKSLDRIGRILFIFYWKNDEFAERYGEQDLAGMEDLLRNVFKSFGSLVLRLQEKAVSEVREMD